MADRRGPTNQTPRTPSPEAPTAVDGRPAAPIDTTEVVDTPDLLDQDPGLGAGVANEHQQDLLPGEDTAPANDADGDDGPADGPSSAADVADGIGLGRVDAGGAPGGTEAEAPMFGATSRQDAVTNPGGLSDHEQGLVDELQQDSMEDPFSIDLESVPAEQSLRGNETGDGGSADSDEGGAFAPGNSNLTAFDGYRLDPYDGFVPGEADKTTVLEQRLDATAGGGLGGGTTGPSQGGGGSTEPPEEPATDGYEPPAEDHVFNEHTYEDWSVPETVARWAVSWFEDDEVDTGTGGVNEDQSPDQAPAPKSPTHDPDIGRNEFGIGVGAERGSEVQFADMPGSGDDQTQDYDGVDYGDGYTEPSFDIAEAEQMLMGDPMDQPDVDPAEFDGDIGTEAATTDGGADEAMVDG